MFLVHRVPFPPDKGDRIRSFHLLKYLAARGTVDLAYLSDAPDEPTTRAALTGTCRRVQAVAIGRYRRWISAAWSLLRGDSLTAGLFASRRLRALIGRWLAETEYDAIVCFSSGVYPYVQRLGLEAQLIVDLVDVDSQKWFDYALHAGWWRAALFRLEGRRVRTLERAADRARVVSLSTQPEAEIYGMIAPRAVVKVVPNGVDLDYFRPRGDQDDTQGCVFVGQLDYHANILSLDWFCRQVWPMVRARCPAVTLRLIGRKPTPAVLRLGSLPGVEVIGPVVDVRPHLATARVVVIPLLVARGVQNKVLEAMAMGRAVVASPAALEGLATTPGLNLRSATTPADWADAIADLWADRPQRLDLGRSARLYVEANHRWEHCLAPLDPYLPAAAGAVPRPGEPTSAANGA